MRRMSLHILRDNDFSCTQSVRGKSKAVLAGLDAVQNHHVAAEICALFCRLIARGHGRGYYGGGDLKVATFPLASDRAQPILVECRKTSRIVRPEFTLWNSGKVGHANGLAYAAVLPLELHAVAGVWLRH